MQQTLSSLVKLALCASVLLVAGCGDGSSSSPVASTAPATATAPVTTTAPIDTPGIQTISMGTGVSCAVRTDGMVRCWGPEKWQKDWDQSKTSVTGPLKQLIINDVYSCALNQSGSVFCWGRGSGVRILGRGGLPDQRNSETPVAVLANVSQLEDADGSVCALTNDGDVYCWGGDSPWGETSSPIVDRPTKITGLPKIKQVSVSYSHRCAVGVDSSIWCWGYFQYGSDGTGRDTAFRSDKPFRVDIPFGGATQVSAGTFITCAVTVRSASVYCWGRNDYGQIGNNDKGNDALFPQKALLESGEMAQQVSVEEDNVCALLASGAARCWGHTEVGILGNGEGGIWGAQKGYEAKPVKVQNSQGEFFGFKGLAVRPRASLETVYPTRCAWGDGNQAWCWGFGGGGQLGDGDFSANAYVKTPKKVQATESGWQ